MATGPNNSGLSADEKAQLDARAKLINEASKNLESYLKALNDVGVLENHINEAIKQRAKLNKDNAELRVKIANSSGQEQAILKKQLQDGQKLLITSSKRINQAKEEVKFQKEALATVKERVVLGKTMWNQANMLGKALLAQTGYLLEQQKAVKETELSMGVLSSQAGAFRKNIYKTAI